MTYALLNRFEKEEIILQAAEENNRKIYKLTEKGQEILKQEILRLNQMASDAKKIIDFQEQGPSLTGNDGEK